MASTPSTRAIDAPARRRGGGGSSLVFVRRRRWAITALPDGEEEEVVPRGSPGVVGQTPTLGQGAEFEYASGTELQAAAGTVRGSFEFVSLEGDERFEAEVPPFALVAPPSEANM